MRIARRIMRTVSPKLQKTAELKEDDHCSDNDENRQAAIRPEETVTIVVD